MKAKILKPPAPFDFPPNQTSIFLAGSIEMGQAPHWQTPVEEAFQPYEVIILNPRRDTWDSTWVQSINNPQFREQVEWELTGQELASVIALYFAPGTQAPISLLEFGLFARSGKLLVCCPDGFHRKGNVEVVCARYGIPLVKDLVQLISLIKDRFKFW